MDTKMFEELKSTWHLMKQEMDAAREESKRLGSETGETKQLVERLDARMDELETKMKRSPIAAAVADTPEAHEAKAKKDLYFKILRSGNFSNLSDEERTKAREYKFMVGPAEAKALALGDDTTGGFLAPSEYVNEIIKGIQLISPVRQIANVRNTTRRSVMVPVRSGVFSASWIGETATRTETTGLSYSMEEVPTYEMYAEVIVSEQDLEDSAFDLEAEIRDNSAEQMAKAEGLAFVSGDSIKKPEGFMTNAAISYDPSGTASTIASAAAGSAGQGDGLVKMAYNLKSGYAQGATWVLNRKSIGKVRLLADTQGRYLWEPGISASQPASILGIPYLEMPDMADEGTNAFPIALGNFKRGYMIVDRVDMVVKRLNEKYAEQGQIAFIVRKRVGGQVVLPEAIRKYKCATS